MRSPHAQDEARQEEPMNQIESNNKKKKKKHTQTQAIVELQRIRT